MPVTKTMAFDHEPYSLSTGGAPEDVVLAVRSGLGQNVFDFDFREVLWKEAPFSSTKVHINSRSKVVKR